MKKIYYIAITFAIAILSLALTAHVQAAETLNSTYSLAETDVTMVMNEHKEISIFSNMNGSHSIEISSSNGYIVEAFSQGSNKINLYALSEGTAVVTVRVGNELTGFYDLTCKVTVIGQTKPILNTTKVILKPGEKVTLSVVNGTMRNADSTTKYTGSQDDSIATINEYGVITGNCSEERYINYDEDKSYTTRVWVDAVDIYGEIVDSLYCEVIVEVEKTKKSVEPPMPGIFYDIKSTPVGLTNKLEVDGAVKKWTSSNTSIATVSNKGVLTAKKKGTVTITATFTNGTKATKKAKIVENKYKYKFNSPFGYMGNGSYITAAEFNKKGDLILTLETWNGNAGSEIFYDYSINIYSVNEEKYKYGIRSKLKKEQKIKVKTYTAKKPFTVNGDIETVKFTKITIKKSELKNKVFDLRNGKSFFSVDYTHNYIKWAKIDETKVKDVPRGFYRPPIVD